MMSKKTGGVLLIVSVLLLAGCDQAEKAAQQALNKTAEAARQAIDDTHQAASQALSDATGGLIVLEKEPQPDDAPKASSHAI